MQSTDFPFAVFWLLLSVFSNVPLLLFGSRFPARLLRFALIGRWVLIPYLGLLTGAISPRLMGLSGIDWVTSLGLGVALLFATLVLLALVRATVATPHLDSGQDEPATPWQWEAAQHSIPLENWATYGWIIILAGCTEFHWAFLRAAVQETLIFMARANTLLAYTAIWVAALLAAPDVLLRTSRALPRIIQVITLASTSVLFLFTQNFWLCWILHAAVHLLLDEETHADHHCEDDERHDEQQA